MFSYKHPFAPQ